MKTLRYPGSCPYCYRLWYNVCRYEFLREQGNGIGCGGSSTLVRYEQPSGRVVIDNRHEPFRRFYRNDSVNLGFYLQ